MTRDRDEQIFKRQQITPDLLTINTQRGLYCGVVVYDFLGSTLFSFIFEAIIQPDSFYSLLIYIH